jgi:hypothetical protein
MRTRLWIMSALVFVVLIVVGGVVYVSTKPDSTNAQWHQATSPSGRYVAEFPEPPTTRTVPMPGNQSMQVTEAKSGETAFALTEVPLTEANRGPLDQTVDKAIEGARAAVEANFGGPVVATEISERKTGDFEGVETRVANFTIAQGGTNMTMRSLVFFHDGSVVQAMVATEGQLDSETADRFFASLASRR